MKNLAHSASFDSEEKDAPSKPGIKQLKLRRSRRSLDFATVVQSPDPKFLHLVGYSVERLAVQTVVVFVEVATPACAAMPEQVMRRLANLPIISVKVRAARRLPYRFKNLADILTATTSATIDNAREDALLALPKIPIGALIRSISASL
jgi:hypothetical protein